MKRLAGILALVLASAGAWAQSTFTGGGATTAAQVVALFTACSGVQYLGADGACHDPLAGTVTNVSGTANQVLVATGTTTPVVSLSPTIVIGTDNSVAGTLTLSNPAAAAHTVWGSGATTTNTINGFATVPTTGRLIDCTVASTTCLLHDSGITTANVVNASAPGVGVAHFAGSTQTVTSSLIVAADITSATITGTQLAASLALTTPNIGAATGTTLSLGTDNSVAGTVTLANSGAAAHTIFSSGATTTNTIQGFAAVPTTGRLIDCTVTTTVCLLHDSGVTTANVVNASSPGAGIAHFAGSTQTVTSSAIVAADCPTCVVNNAANTGTTAMTLNMGASTTANAFIVPIGAGLTSGADGAIAYDTTNKNTHVRSNGADGFAVAEAALIAANTVVKATSATLSSLVATTMVDNGTVVKSTGVGGFLSAPASASGGVYCGQGTAAGTNTTAVGWTCPTSVTSYNFVAPAAGGSGILTNTFSGSAVTQGFSGDSGHSATVTTGSGTSVGSTSLCSTALCPVGTYRVNVYIDITTACGTSGTYIVNLIYTDDQGSKTIPVNLEGTGSVPATGVLTTTSTANFGYQAVILRSTGGASINYSTTATACGTAGPMVGKLYLSVEPVM